MMAWYGYIGEKRFLVPDLERTTADFKARGGRLERPGPDVDFSDWQEASEETKQKTKAKAK